MENTRSEGQNFSEVVVPQEEEEDIVEPGGPRMTIRYVRIACWTPKAKNTHSEYAIHIVFPLQQLL